MPHMFRSPAVQQLLARVEQAAARLPVSEVVAGTLIQDPEVLGVVLSQRDAAGHVAIRRPDGVVLWLAPQRLVTLLASAEEAGLIALTYLHLFNHLPSIA